LGANCPKIKESRDPFRSPKIAQISDRLILSPNQRTGLVASIAKEGGVNIDDLSFSSETVKRTSKKDRTDITRNVKINFTAPKNCALRWVTKIVTNQDKVVFHILAVLISVVSGFEESKLLSVPAILGRTAQSQANKVFEIFNIVSEIFSVLCFDTTASDIG
ncbi:hypothetical protein AVEN_10740-1, partial [Araneus ventricosus]